MRAAAGGDRCGCKGRGGGGLHSRPGNESTAEWRVGAPTVLVSGNWEEYKDYSQIFGEKFFFFIHLFNEYLIEHLLCTKQFVICWEVKHDLGLTLEKQSRGSDGNEIELDSYGTLGHTQRWRYVRGLFLILRLNILIPI